MKKNNFGARHIILPNQVSWKRPLVETSWQALQFSVLAINLEFLNPMCEPDTVEGLPVYGLYSRILPLSIILIFFFKLSYFFHYLTRWALIVVQVSTATASVLYSPFIQVLVGNLNVLKIKTRNYMDDAASYTVEIIASGKLYH